jgi:hypothetical protein
MASADAGHGGLRAMTRERCQVAVDACQRLAVPASARCGGVEHEGDGGKAQEQAGVVARADLSGYRGADPPVRLLPCPVPGVGSLDVKERDAGGALAEGLRQPRLVSWRRARPGQDRGEVLGLPCEPRLAERGDRHLASGGCVAR